MLGHRRCIACSALLILVQVLRYIKFGKSAVTLDILEQLGQCHVPWCPGWHWPCINIMEWCHPHENINNRSKYEADGAAYIRNEASKEYVSNCFVISNFTNNSTTCRKSCVCIWGRWWACCHSQHSGTIRSMPCPLMPWDGTDPVSISLNDVIHTKI